MFVLTLILPEEAVSLTICYLSFSPELEQQAAKKLTRLRSCEEKDRDREKGEAVVKAHPAGAVI